MAKNFVQPGRTLTLTAPSGGVVAGLGYVIGGLFVVAQNTAAQGQPFEGMTEGVFEMKKATHASTKAFTEGEAIFWDNGSNKRWDKTGSGLFPAGRAVADTASTSDVVRVLIDGHPGTAVG